MWLSPFSRELVDEVLKFKKGNFSGLVSIHRYSHHQNSTVQIVPSKWRSRCISSAFRYIQRTLHIARDLARTCYFCMNSFLVKIIIKQNSDKITRKMAEVWWAESDLCNLAVPATQAECSEDMPATRLDVVRLTAHPAWHINQSWTSARPSVFYIYMKQYVTKLIKFVTIEHTEIRKIGLAGRRLYHDDATRDYYSHRVHSRHNYVRT